MNSLEKLQDLARNQNERWAGLDQKTRTRILRMYGSMKWVYVAEAELRKNGQEIFFEYYTPEDGAFVKKVHDSVFK